MSNYLKYSIILIVLSTLVGCFKNPNDFDFNLRKEEVICEPVIEEETIVGGRTPSTYIMTTSKCYFSYKTSEDIRQYNERKKLKELITKDKLYE